MIGNLLKTYWLSKGIKVGRGVTEKIIEQFEQKYSVRLPEDVCDYFIEVNGMDNSSDSEYWVWDDQEITFWSLQDITRLPTDAQLIRVHNPTCLFEFADWSICAHTYAIHLSNNLQEPNPVYVLYDQPIQIANSFTEFALEYIKTNNDILFPDPRNSRRAGQVDPIFVGQAGLSPPADRPQVNLRLSWKQQAREFQLSVE
ncbi:MAG: SMI1/KNR4 family protein, partial [Acidobacteria bacterium]|nr:SMI1/KNR4 family protein [Acidobacteriota bacterium]